MKTNIYSIFAKETNQKYHQQLFDINGDEVTDQLTMNGAYTPYIGPEPALIKGYFIVWRHSQALALHRGYRSLHEIKQVPDYSGDWLASLIG